MSNDVAGSVVAGLIWAGCVLPDDEAALDGTLSYARPSTILWMNEELITVGDPTQRAEWFRVSRTTKVATQKLMAQWGISIEQWYGDREGIRKHGYQQLLDNGAIAALSEIDTNSSGARWVLVRSFAELFNPHIEGDDLVEAIVRWSERHLSRSARVRAALARKQEKAALSISVSLPDGTTRHLAPGKSSVLLQGAIEGWAALRLREPAVLTISEPGDKVFVADGALLESAGISIDVSKLLPDALLVEMATEPLQFWVVEAVATSGPVNERRKLKFLEWAETQDIDRAQLNFLSVFFSRHNAIAKKYLPELASGTYAWFLNEPDQELFWGEIPPDAS